MNYKIEYIKDIYDNNYLAILFNKSEVSRYINEMEEHVFDKDLFEKLINNKKLRDGDRYHMTVINVMEFNKLFDMIPNFQERLDVILDMNITDIRFKGIGMSERLGDQAYYVVVESPTIDEIRSSLGLKEHDLHITLGFNTKDVHGVRKNEVLKKKTKIEKLNDIYFDKYGASWVKNINNIKEDFKDIPNDKIKFISKNDSHLKYQIGDYTITIGYVNDEMRVLTIN